MTGLVAGRSSSSRAMLHAAAAEREPLWLALAAAVMVSSQQPRRGGDESTTPSDMTIDYKVSSFQINLSSGFENKLLPNDLIIVRNHGDDDKDVGEEFGDVVDQQGQPSRVEFESASESWSSSR